MTRDTTSIFTFYPALRVAFYVRNGKTHNAGKRMIQTVNGEEEEAVVRARVNASIPEMFIANRIDPNRNKFSLKDLRP